MARITYDETDRRISAWMQAQWVAFARDGAPADDTVWRSYGEDKRVLLIDDDIHQGGLEDDPLVRLLHSLRTIKPASQTGLFGLWHRLWH